MTRPLISKNCEAASGISDSSISLGAKKPASPQNAAAPKIASATKAMIINLIIFPIHKPRFS